MKSLGLSTSRSLCNFDAWRLNTGLLNMVPTCLSFINHVKTILSSCGCLAWFWPFSVHLISEIDHFYKIVQLLFFFQICLTLAITANLSMTKYDFHFGIFSLLNIRDLWNLLCKNGRFYRLIFTLNVISWEAM